MANPAKVKTNAIETSNASPAAELASYGVVGCAAAVATAETPPLAGVAAAAMVETGHASQVW